MNLHSKMCLGPQNETPIKCKIELPMDTLKEPKGYNYCSMRLIKTNQILLCEFVTKFHLFIFKILIHHQNYYKIKFTNFVHI
jgi:hypothetical protein